MNLKLDIVKDIYDNFSSKGVLLFYLDDLPFISGKRIHKTKGSPFVSDKHYNILKENNILDINVLIDDKLIDCLIAMYPKKYRFHQYEDNYIVIDKQIIALKEINKKSNRIRYIIGCEEIYSKNNNNVVMEYYSQWNFERWNFIKLTLDKNKKYRYRFSESGIIIIADLKNQKSSRQHNEARKLTGTIFHLLKYNTSGKLISEDFIPQYDIDVITDPEHLLSEYMHNNKRLIIIVEPITHILAKALSDVKKWDTFARMQIISNIEPSKCGDFYLRVSNMYNKDTWDIDNF